LDKKQEKPAEETPKGIEEDLVISIKTQHTVFKLFQLPNFVEEMAEKAKKRLIKEGVLDEDY
jgi:hypothetical protein